MDITSREGTDNLKRIIEEVIQFFKDFFKKIAEAFGQIHFGRGYGGEVNATFPAFEE